jgi:mRNA interferase RelE/StbE
VASYRLLIKLSAAKELEKTPQKDRRRLVPRTRVLADEPRPWGMEKVRGRSLCRIRQGDCRILYEVFDHDLTVTIVKIGHRREVYS